MKCICVEYGMELTKLTKELLENNAELYHGALLALRVKELQDQSAGIKKLRKATKTGTKITFKIIHTKEEALEAIEALNEDIKEYNTRFNKKLSTVSLVEN